MERIDTTIVVETPERVGFRYRIAGPATRGAAWSIDLMFQGLLMIGLAMFAGAAGFAVGAASMGVFLVGMFTLTWFYGTFCELLLAGRTPGKMVVGIRAVKRDGAPLGLREAVLRNLVRAVDSLPVGYVVGVVTMVMDGSGRRIGDLVADTIVISERSTQLLADVVIEPEVSDDERRMLPARVNLSRRERRAIEDLLRRRDRYTPAFIEEIASHLGPALGRRERVESSTWLRVLTLAYAKAMGRDA